MTDHYDISGQLINEGDWIVHPHDRGCLKFAIVVKQAKTGTMRAASFQFLKKWHRGNGKVWWDDHEKWYRSGPYNLLSPEHCLVVDRDRIPTALLEHIKNDLKGDPLYNPDKTSI